jgi:chorismate dehydratase
MDNKIKISAVSYLNSKPFLYGLFRNDFEKTFSLSLDYPSECGRKLANFEADLGLIPVALIPHIKNAQIISDFCISADGPVKTVCIFSSLPLEEVDSIYLDYQSRTSVQLLKVLLRDYWKLNPNLIEAPLDYIDKISGKTAGLIIGDRTFGLEKNFPFVYDLSEAWKNHCGFPFVFAAWVTNRQLSQSFIQDFNACLADGVERIEQVAQLFQSSHLNFNVLEYYTKYISFDFDSSKKESLEYFLAKIEEERLK